MRPITEMAHGMWRYVALAGGSAVVAAAAVGPWPDAPTRLIGAWALFSAVVVIYGAYRSPGGFPLTAPLLGAAITGLVLGVVLILLPSTEPRTGTLAVGVWGIIAAAGYRAIARIVRDAGAPDGGLFTTAWAGIIAGMTIVLLTVFGFATSWFVAGGALAAVGALTLLASVRLRLLPLEVPAEPSRRELRRRERAGRRR